MPQTIEGIGTWYWGKKIVHTHMGVCEFCGAYARLRSYETNLFFVVLFIPLIPLGKRRVLNECSVCHRHRAAPLKEWEQARSQGVAEAVRLMREDPQNQDKAKEAIRTLVSFQDERNFLQVAPVLRQFWGAHAELLAMLGGAYAYFGKTEEAEQIYRTSMALNDTPEIRESLAMLLVRQSRSSEARPLLEHVLRDKLNDKIGFLGAVVDGFQAEGKHDEALEILNQIAAAFPEVTKEKVFQEKKKLSEKHRGTGKQIKADHLQGPTGGGSESEGTLRMLMPRIIGATVVLGIAGVYLLAAFFMGQSRKVYIVNGLDRAYTVELNGAPVQVGGKAFVETKVKEGPVEVRVTDAGLGIEKETCRVKTTFWTRPFLNRTFVINPDKMALVIWEQTEYVKGPDPNSKKEMPFQLHVGQLCYTFKGVDYRFEDFPREIRVKGGSRPLKKSRVYHEVSIPPAQAMAWIRETAGDEASDAFVRRLVASNPTNDLYLPLLSISSKPAEAIALMRTRLADRPVLVEWHRMYQELCERYEPKHDLETEYRAYFEKDNADNTLRYLLGRVVENDDESDKLFQQAASGNDPCPEAFGALAYGALTSGRFEEALAAWDKALALRPGKSSFTSGRTQALLGLGRYGDLLQTVQAGRKKQPLNLQLAAEEIELRMRQGDKNGARQIITDYVAAVKQKFDPEQAASWESYLEAMYRYSDGDVDGYGERMLQSGAYEYKFETAISLGKVEEAIAAAKDHAGRTADEHLLIYLAAETAGQKDVAAQHLELAAQALDKLGQDERRAAEYLLGKREMDPAKFIRIPTDVEQKLLLMAAMGMKYPQHREQFFALARKLNYGLEFPHLFLKKITG